MNEAETRAEHIDPALKAAGWGVVEGSRVLREHGITRKALALRSGVSDAFTITEKDIVDTGGITEDRVELDCEIGALVLEQQCCILRGRAAVGADPASPVDRLPAAPAGAQVGIGDIPQAAAGAANMAMRRGAARDAAGNSEAASVTPEAGGISYDPKTKTYSGTDVKAGAEITGGAAGGRGTRRGTVNSIGTIGVEGYQQQLANIRGLGTPDSTVGQGPAGIGAATIGSDLRAKTDARLLLFLAPWPGQGHRYR